MGLRIEKKPSLKEVEKHFIAWRAQQPRPRTIPEQLWAEAVGLLSAYTVNKVARTLRLDHARLKKRAILAGVLSAKDTQGGGKVVSFMETSVVEMTSEAATHPMGVGLQVVIKRPDGMEMVISGGSLEASALGGVVAGFCYGGR